MQKEAQNPTVSLADIRNVYPHLPPASTPIQPSAMNHPAILVFVHDPENAANAAGQVFLHKNNEPMHRSKEPLAVAAQMIGADYKIFDLSPPERQTVPAPESDLALAVSYGMVAVEQGVDFLALLTLGQETETVLSKINTLDDVRQYGAMNVAAAYGAWIAARMAQIETLTSASLSRCLEAIAADEDEACPVPSATSDLKEFALNLVRERALRQII